MAVADVDHRMALGARDLLQVRVQRRGQVDQVAFVDIGRSAVHGVQHPVGHYGWAGDRKQGSTKIE